MGGFKRTTHTHTEKGGGETLGLDTAKRMFGIQPGTNCVI